MKQEKNNDYFATTSFKTRFKKSVPFRRQCCEKCKTETKAKITSDDRFSPPIQMFSLNEMISINHMDVF